MNFAIVYLAHRTFFHLLDFFHHWYVDASRVFAHAWYVVVASIEQTLAVKVTLRHFIEPLYGDYSFIGRILGVVFRTFRLLLGLVTYILFTLCFGALYVAWLSTPLLIVFYVFKNI